MANFTKKALAEQLKEMLQTKPMDKITVTDLVEACQVKRQTFYYHFQDIYDLLGWIYTTEAVESIKNSKSYDTWQQGLLIILEYVNNNKQLCINTSRSLGKEHLEMFLNNVLNVLIGDVVEEIARDYAISTKDKAFITKFYGYAFAGTLLDWIGNGMKAPCEEVANYISITMEGNILAAIKRLSKK